jgi:hypothetical protein
VSVFHQAKQRFDALMLRYLRGADPAVVVLEPWQTHDLRRVVRTKLAAQSARRSGLERQTAQHRGAPPLKFGAAARLCWIFLTRAYARVRVAGAFSGTHNKG